MITAHRCRAPVWAALAATLALPLAAQADYRVATAAGTYVGFTRGCDATYNGMYGGGSHFVVNGSAAVCSSSPISGLDGSVPYEIIYDGVVDPTGTRTAAWDRTFQGINNRDTTATARAAADLGTASLHAFAQGAGNAPGAGARKANATATFLDTLHFTVAGAGASDTTLITVRMTLDGHVADPVGPSNMYLVWNAYFGNAWAKNYAHAFNPTSTFQAYSQTESGWVSFNRLSNMISPDNTDIVIEATYALQGPSADIVVGGELVLEVENATLDFENTGTLSLVLPSNVSYTSDSGVFLTAADPGTGNNVPEPASALLVLVALGILRATGCQRVADSTEEGVELALDEPGQLRSGSGRGER